MGILSSLQRQQKGARVALSALPLASSGASAVSFCKRAGHFQARAGEAEQLAAGGADT